MTSAWESTEIGGKPADVYGPPTQKPRYGVIHLHGAGLETLRDNKEFTRLFDQLNLACVCPHGARSWWTDRICPEFDPQISAERYLLEQIVPFFRVRWQLAPRSVGIQGISMGGQGALRLAFKYPEVFPIVAAIAPALDYHELYGQGTPLDDMYDSREQCRQDTVILHIHPSKYPSRIFFCIDPDDAMWYRGNDRLHEKLSALGIPHEVDLTTSGGGHTWDYYNRMAERVENFIVSGLEQESLRLV
jgi:S-formylglutathione hydrolase